MNQMDPMLSWQKLSRKILSKYSLFEDALERAHLKSTQDSQNNLEKLFEPPPVQIFQILLVQIDELINSIKTMLEECCNVLPFENESSLQILHLNSSQSHCKYFFLIRVAPAFKQNALSVSCLWNKGHLKVQNDTKLTLNEFK